MPAPSPKPPRRTILVSACLLGRRCRHDGRDKEDPTLRERAGAFAILVPACPEELGGLGTPRPAAELVGGDGEAVLDGKARVENAAGRDVTAEFVAGAKAALAVAREAGATEAFLVERSPSCGCSATHVGGAVVAGRGVTAALFAREGIRVTGVGDSTPSR